MDAIDWKDEAVHQIELHAPRLQREHAVEIAAVLLDVFHDRTPAQAAALWFFQLPPAWRDIAANRL